MLKMAEDEDQNNELQFVSQLDRETFRLKYELQELCSLKGVNAQNIPIITSFIMRRLNAIRIGNWWDRKKLPGATKKKMAVVLISFAVFTFAGPEVAAVFPTVVLVDVLENCYIYGLHRIKTLRF
jgi:hypothetical protein